MRREKIFEKNTGDLQWKMHANYNPRPYARLRKAAGAKAMENNEKNNEKTMKEQSNVGNSRRCGRRPVDPKQNRPPPRGAGRGFPRLEFMP